MQQTEIQLTQDASGHCIHHMQVFSPDSEWIVFDSRNDDSKIGSTGSIKRVNIKTGVIEELYKTSGQSAYGPGVGAATFSPTRQRVLFIHGIRNADAEKPYSFTRRTGVAIDIAQPNHPLFLDARDIVAPFTAGALRGGTHAHAWSADGEWISFTYNDYVLEQLSKTDSTVKDLRTVGVMMPLKKVTVPGTASLENNDGELFAVVVTTVKENPAPGSDEIDKAFDETWIGEKGYRQASGNWQERAIAFQGNVYDTNGLVKTEIFVADLPADLSIAQTGLPLQGTASSRPAVPAGVTQRRISFTETGVQGPRHWLRSLPDGSMIGFMMRDTEGFFQVFGISPNGGEITQLSFAPSSLQGPFNFSPGGGAIAYIADNSVFITYLDTKQTERLTPKATDAAKPLGAVVWSPDGKWLAYNRYVETAAGKFLQIFLLPVPPAPGK